MPRITVCHAITPQTFLSLRLFHLGMKLFAYCCDVNV